MNPRNPWLKLEHTELPLKDPRSPGSCLVLAKVICVLACLGSFQVSAAELMLTAWGFNFFGEATVPTNLSGVVSMQAGVQVNVVLRNDATVAVWGWSAYGQTNVPPSLSNVVAVSTHIQCMALRNDGSMSCWGYNRPEVLNPPATVTNIAAIAAG